MKTRLKDCTGSPIFVGDVLFVSEHPDKYVGGSIEFTGLVSVENGIAIVTYWDIGEEESFPISMFPVNGRKVLEEAGRYKFWRECMLGAEPDPKLYKQDLYRQYAESCLHG